MTNIRPPATTNPPLPFAELIGSAVRWGMTFVGSWLLEQGLTNPDTTEAVITGGAGVIMAGIALLWGQAQKWLNQKALHTALVLPAGSTIADLKAAGAKLTP